MRTLFLGWFLVVHRESANLLPKSTSISHTLNNLRGFKLAHLNIASIPKHIDQLKVLLLNKPVDIFSINETRLDDTISSEEIFLDMKYSEKTDQELVVVSFSI